MTTHAAYDELGQDYSRTRQPDPHWQQAIERLTASTGAVLNVGAGTGSYEPRRPGTIAVEPAMTMIRQRGAEAAPVVQAVAEALPFRDGTFTTVMSVLSVHHWRARAAAFCEVGRVARDKAVFITWDPDHPGFWLTNDYFPEILAIDRDIFPSLDEFRHSFGRIDVAPLLIPRHCIDGFLGAYWARPHTYLNPAVRAGMSTFAKIEHADVGVTRLQADLRSGVWQSKHGAATTGAFADLGYRSVTVTLR